MFPFRGLFFAFFLAVGGRVFELFAWVPSLMFPLCRVRHKESVEFSGTPNNGSPYPYNSHTTPIRIPKDMGIVWVPLTIRGPMSLGVPGKSSHFVDAWVMLDEFFDGCGCELRSCIF